MARTYRRIPAHWLRRPKTTNCRRGEHCTVIDMLAEEIPVRNRFRKRGNLTSRQIPTSWDDIIVAALYEALQMLPTMKSWDWRVNHNNGSRAYVGQKHRITMPQKWNKWGCCVFQNERGSGRNV
ncbi:MAG: hypothetical protein ACTSUK_01715 [Promethearchaeota archaeon]